MYKVGKTEPQRSLYFRGIFVNLEIKYKTLDFLNELTYVREQGRKAKHYSSLSFVITRIYDEVHLRDLCISDIRESCMAHCYQGMMHCRRLSCASISE